MDSDFEEDDIRVIISTDHMDESRGSNSRPGYKRTADEVGARTGESAPKRRKVSSSTATAKAYAEDSESESYVSYTTVLLPELWQHNITFVPIKTVGLLSLASESWSRASWQLLNILDISNIVSTWNLSVIVNKAVSRGAASIRELRLPPCEFENQEWESSFFSKLGGLTSLRAIDVYADLPDTVLELLFLGPRRTAVEIVDEPMQQVDMLPEIPQIPVIDLEGNAVPGTPPRAPRPDLVHVRLSKPAIPRGRFPLLERITFRKLVTSEQVFGRVCKAFPHLNEVDFIHCRGKKVTEQHLQHLLDVPKLPKNIIFFWSVGFNHATYSMELLKLYPREIDVNCHHRSGQTPLTRACKKRYWSTVLDLIRSDRGVDVNVKARDGIAALHYAARDDNVEVLKELIRAGARVDEPKSDGCRSLHIAATYGWVNVVKALLEAQADVNAASKAGSTALHYASLYGQPEALRVLLAAHPAVDALYTGGWTALHLAVRRNYLDMAKDLLDANANPNVAETHGWTPLHSAVYKGYTSMVELLLKYSPNLEAVDKKHGRTPLHFAAMSNVGPIAPGSAANAPNTVVGPNDAKNIMRMLLDANANSNAMQSKNRTALHLAAGNGFEKGVELLLERGADMWIKDRWHSTALHYAVDSGSEATVSHLLRYELSHPSPQAIDGDIEKRAPHGTDMRTPVFIAAQKGLSEIVKMLLSHPSHRQEATTLCYGLSPLEAALLMQHKDVVDVFLLITGASNVEHQSFAPGQRMREELIKRVLDRERYMQTDLPFACDGRKRAQNFWRCMTCGHDGDHPFCSSCAVKCHTGHQVDWRGVSVMFCGCSCASDAEVRARKDSKTKRKGNGDHHAIGPHMPQYRSTGHQGPMDPLATIVPHHRH